MYRITIDVGGTFTDCLVMDGEGALRQFKAYTTPRDPSQGFLDAVTKAAAGYGHASLGDFLAQVELIIHGTTLATNTLINRNGARTGMIPPRVPGHHRDPARLQERADLHVRRVRAALRAARATPSASRGDRAGALLRRDPHGAGRGEARAAAERLKEKGVEAVVIGFLHSYADPTNEQRASAIAREVLPDAYVTASHEILPVWREYERFSTAVVSAYTGPIVERYLRTLVARLATEGFRGNLLMMLSDGLVETVDYCIPRVVYLIGSGPAAAPRAPSTSGMPWAAATSSRWTWAAPASTSAWCATAGSHDHRGMGPRTSAWPSRWWTSSRVARVAGRWPGSTSWACCGSAPERRRRPGPACYAKGGTEPAVTDADLVLGYVPADYFLGGEIALDEGAARTAVAKVADPLGLSVEEAASAMLTTVNSYMADQIAEVATRRGHDVRDFALVAGGGAGPVHAAAIADLLHMPQVVIPPIAATYSAFGMFAMDVGRNYARSYITRAKDLDPRAWRRCTPRWRRRPSRASPRSASRRRRDVRADRRRPLSGPVP
ncbi:MAG: hydantoinase/oxoprolinase family protein [Chloroflexota bacterium]